MATKAAAWPCWRLLHRQTASLPAARIPPIIATHSLTRQSRFSSATPRLRQRESKSRSSHFSRVRFTIDDLPGRDFWAAISSYPAARGLTPEHCATAVEKYVSLAIADGPGWRQAHLGLSEDLSLRTLHYAAALLLNGPPSAAWDLAMHILHSNVVLAYPASVLSVVRMSLERGLLGEPQFGLAEQAFSRLAARRQDANACALQGLIFASKGTPDGDDKAVEWLTHAISLAEGPRSPKSTSATGDALADWDWGISAYRELGRLYIQRGQPEEARKVLTVAVELWDDRLTTYHLSTLLGDDDPARRTLLERAAASGVEDAARDLMEKCRVESRDERRTRSERAELEVLADEWARLRDTSTLS